MIVIGSRSDVYKGQLLHKLIKCTVYNVVGLHIYWIRKGHDNMFVYARSHGYADLLLNYSISQVRLWQWCTELMILLHQLRFRVTV